MYHSYDDSPVAGFLRLAMILTSMFSIFQFGKHRGQIEVLEAQEESKHEAEIRYLREEIEKLKKA